MTAKLAEKIVALGKQIGVELNGPVFYSQLESLLSAALDDARYDALRIIKENWNEALALAQSKAYEDAAQIAEVESRGWDTVGQRIVEAIRAKAAKVGK